MKLWHWLALGAAIAVLFLAIINTGFFRGHFLKSVSPNGHSECRLDIKLYAKNAELEITIVKRPSGTRVSTFKSIIFEESWITYLAENRANIQWLDNDRLAVIAGQETLLVLNIAEPAQ